MIKDSANERDDPGHASQPKASPAYWITHIPTPALILATVLALLLAIVFGATRPNKGDPPSPQVSRDVPSAVISFSAVSEELMPAPELAELNAYITALEDEHHATIGVAISPMALPFEAGQESWHGGRLYGGRALETLALPMAIAILDEPKQPQDRDYLFNRSLAQGSPAATSAMWAYLGEPGQAAPKVDQTLRRLGDTRTVVSLDERGENYLATSWRLDDQANALGVLGCRYISYHSVLSQLNDRKADSWGMDHLPMSLVISGSQYGSFGDAEIRQAGLIYLGDGTRVSVAFIINVQSGDLNQAKQIADELAYAIRNLARGIQGPECSVT